MLCDLLHACKVSVDAFSLLYSKLLLKKLGRFVFGFTFAKLHWQFISNVAAIFVTSVCRLLSLRG